MSISNNTQKLQNLMDKINALPEYKEGIELPELSNEGSSADLLNNKQLIDSEGNIITGSMKNNGTINTTFDGINTKSYTIPKGYTDGGTVSLDNTIDNEVDLQEDLIAQIQTIADNLPNASSGNGGSGKVETCTVEYNLYEPGSTVINNEFLYSVNCLSYENNEYKLQGDKGSYNSYISGSGVLYNVPKNSLCLLEVATALFDRELTGAVKLRGMFASSYIKVYAFLITDNCTLSFDTCFVKGTKIRIKGNIFKEVQDITYEDELLAWDFDNGCYTYARPIWIKKPEIAKYYYKCKFADGNELKLVGSNGKCHRIFSINENKFLSATDCVGHHVMTEHGITTLLSCERIDEIVEFYNIITKYHINLFAENVLTSCRLNNIYPIKDMKFVKDERDIVTIEQYDNIDRSFYDGLRLAERNIEDIDMLNKYTQNLYRLKLPFYN